MNISTTFLESKEVSAVPAEVLVSKTSVERGNDQHLQLTTVNISMSWSRQKCLQSQPDVF